jgi:hypothetical protein
VQENPAIQIRHAYSPEVRNNLALPLPMSTPTFCPVSHRRRMDNPDREPLWCRDHPPSVYLCRRVKRDTGTARFSPKRLCSSGQPWAVLARFVPHSGKPRYAPGRRFHPSRYRSYRRHQDTSDKAAALDGCQHLATDPTDIITTREHI